jgi:transcription-repair coupling factor (superfamily II helicase)
MILKAVTDRFSHSDEFRLLGPSPVSSAVEGIAASSFPVITGALYHRSPGQYLVITETSQKMQDMYLDLSCVIPEQELYMLPPWETLPYEFVSAPEKIEKERITSLYRILSGQPSVIVTSIEAVIRKIPGRDFFLKKGLVLEKGEEYPFEDIIDTLVTYGYSRESRVESFGHFSVKGGIIDVFLPSHENPVRLDFFDNELESIRGFDVNSQISLGNQKSVTIYPRRELILFSQERKTITDALKKALSQGLELPKELAAAAESGTVGTVPGIEDLFPLFVDGESLLSWFGKDAQVILCDPPEIISRKISWKKHFPNSMRGGTKQPFVFSPKSCWTTVYMTSCYPEG